jgi:diaminohydroxyphosphoribosylaminopyrimidine deaminase/5-amino-6-(5-phosphoribosylamino)uracil reductase
LKGALYFCPMSNDEQWMERALQLAEYGRGTVSPNPMVGCVIVSQNKIIGEGWHRHYGGPHAEVWAVDDAEKRGNGHLLSESTVYVTLEPCSHTGKTPPCADLLVAKQVKRVVVCNTDPNPLVAGRGIKRLLESGIEVDCDVLALRGLDLNKRFFTQISKNRPYVILKWAETADGFLTDKNDKPIQISGQLSNMRVHKWRSEEDAILVGYNTAVNDNPKLNVRHWEGTNPVRIVVDRFLKLPEILHLFDHSQQTIVVNYKEETVIPDFPERYATEKKIAYLKIKSGNDELKQLLWQLSKRGIQSVLVEGGATMLKSFLDAGLWDEIRRCQGNIVSGGGVPAPSFTGVLTDSEKVQGDLWSYYVARDPYR